MSKSCERALAVLGALEKFSGDVLPASWLASSLGKRLQALLRATSIFATVRWSKSSVIIQMSFPSEG
jgi:hypothetical protein